MTCKIWHLAVITVILSSFLVGSTPLDTQAAPPAQGDHLSLSGKMSNPQGGGVKEVEIEVLVNGRAVKPEGDEEHLTTGTQGD